MSSFQTFLNNSLLFKKPLFLPPSSLLLSYLKTETETYFTVLSLFGTPTLNALLCSSPRFKMASARSKRKSGRRPNLSVSRLGAYSNTNATNNNAYTSKELRAALEREKRYLQSIATTNNSLNTSRVQSIRQTIAHAETSKNKKIVSLVQFITTTLKVLWLFFSPPSIDTNLSLCSTDLRIQ